jgi:glycosyltransferase involved in cell wall biosynthesis
VILSVRSDILKQPFFIKKISRYLYNKMDYTHAITKVMVKNLTSIGIKNIVHIYNGHDFRSYKKLAEEDIAYHFPNNKFIYLNIGRLTHAKGHWHLIKAFSISARRDKNIFLVIIGEGELEDELRHLIKILDIEDRVAILANASNIFPYLKRADCFTFTSLYEGLPNVLIEASSVGIPILSTDCISGPREILCPELSIDEKISYPYTSNSNVLTSPFPLSDPKIDTNTSIGEKEYANAMEKMKFSRKNNIEYNENNYNFSNDSVHKKWHKLIGKLLKI